MNPVVLTIFSLFLYGYNFAREYVTPLKPGATDAKMINTRAQAQHSNSIIGVWLTAEKDGKVEIFLSGDKYYGKLIWGKKLYEEDGKTLKKDVKNNEVKLRDRPLLNMVMLSDFVYRDGEWTDGKIYDPRSGKTYSSTLKLKDGDLEVRGYIGLPAFGKSTVWTRSSK